MYSSCWGGGVSWVVMEGVVGGGRWKVDWDGGGGGGETNHVEGDDILEGDAAGFVGGDEEAVDGDWAGAGGEAEDEGVGGGGVEVFDSVWGVLVGGQAGVGVRVGVR